MNFVGGGTAIGLHHVYTDSTRLLHNGLAAYKENGIFSDVAVLSPNGRRIWCHQLVLSSCSKKFAGALESGDFTGHELPVLGVDADALELIISFFYTAQCPITVTTAIPLLDAAIKLDVPGLTSACEQFINQLLHPLTVITFLEQSLTVKLDTVTEVLSGYIVSRFDEVTSSGAWLGCEYSTFSKVMLDNKDVQSESALFGAAYRWLIQHASRAELADGIFRFLGISPQGVHAHAQALQNSGNAGNPIMHPRTTDGSTSSPTLQHSTSVQQQQLQQQMAAAQQQHQQQMASIQQQQQQQQIASMQQQQQQMAPVQQQQHELVPVQQQQQQQQLVPVQQQQLAAVQQQQQQQLASVQQQLACVQQHQQALGQGPIRQLDDVVRGRGGGGAGDPLGLRAPSAGGQLQQRLSGAAAAPGGGGQLQHRLSVPAASGPPPQQQQQHLGGPLAPYGVPAVSSPVLPATLPTIGRDPVQRMGGGMCHVEGCNSDLTQLRDYHQRFKICDYHLKVSSILKDGVPQRFCQQCGRFHLLTEFDGQKRSCRSRLMRHNARRRKRALGDVGGGDDDDLGTRGDLSPARAFIGGGAFLGSGGPRAFTPGGGGMLGQGGMNPASAAAAVSALYQQQRLGIAAHGGGGMTAAHGGHTPQDVAQAVIASVAAARMAGQQAQLQAQLQAQQQVQQQAQQQAAPLPAYAPRQDLSNGHGGGWGAGQAPAPAGGFGAGGAWGATAAALSPAGGGAGGGWEAAGATGAAQAPGGGFGAGGAWGAAGAAAPGGGFTGGWGATGAVAAGDGAGGGGGPALAPPGTCFTGGMGGGGSGSGSADGNTASGDRDDDDAGPGSVWPLMGRASEPSEYAVDADGAAYGDDVGLGGGGGDGGIDGGSDAPADGGGDGVGGHSGGRVVAPPAVYGDADGGDGGDGGGGLDAPAAVDGDGGDGDGGAGLDAPPTVYGDVDGGDGGDGGGGVDAVYGDADGGGGGDGGVGGDVVYGDADGGGGGGDSVDAPATK